MEAKLIKVFIVDVFLTSDCMVDVLCPLHDTLLDLLVHQCVLSCTSENFSSIGSKFVAFLVIDLSVGLSL